MPDEHNQAGEQSPATEDEDAQREVLTLVLAEHPAPYTVAELIGELGGVAADFARRDAIDRAVTDLVGFGLLHRQGYLVVPTRAALRSDQLLGR